MPRIEYNKGKVEGHKLEIREILGTLSAPSSPLDKTLSESPSVANLASIDPRDTATIPVPESGMSLALSSLTSYNILITPYISTSTLQPADV